MMSRMPQLVSRPTLGHSLNGGVVEVPPVPARAGPASRTPLNGRTTARAAAISSRLDRALQGRLLSIRYARHNRAPPLRLWGLRDPFPTPESGLTRKRRSEDPGRYSVAALESAHWNRGQ